MYIYDYVYVLCSHVWLRKYVYGSVEENTAMFSAIYQCQWHGPRLVPVLSKIS